MPLDQAAIRSPRLRISLAGASILAFVASGSLACDPGHEVSYDNRTGTPVDVFINGQFDASVEPYSSLESDLIEFDEANFKAKTADGKVVFSTRFTWEELKEADWRIIITKQERRTTRWRGWFFGNEGRSTAS